MKGSNVSEVTKISIDTTEAEANLERVTALAERFKEIWGDSPMPDGIEKFSVNEGDRVVFRYEGQLDEDETNRIKEQIESIMPEIKPLVLTGGLRLDGILTQE